MSYQLGCIDGEHTVAGQCGGHSVEVDSGRQHEPTCEDLSLDGVAFLLLNLAFHHHRVVDGLHVDVARLEILDVDHHLEKEVHQN